MHWRSFVAGFVLAAIISTSGAYWVHKQVESSVVWQPKSFFEFGNEAADQGYLSFGGTLLGEDMLGSTYVRGRCYQSRKTCDIEDVSKYGLGVSTIMFNDDEFAIRSWQPKIVVAESEPMPDACNKVRLLIDREAQTVNYLRIPQPSRDKKRCSIFKERVFNWSLGDAPTV